MRSISTPLLLAGSIMALGSHALADTINVPGDQPSISAAISAAAPGDTILVADGTYNEALTINKAVTIEAVNPGAAVVTGQNALIGAVRVEATGVTLRGLSIEDSPFRGISVETTGNLVLDQVSVSGSGQDAGGDNTESSGLVVEPGGTVTITITSSAFDSNLGRGWTVDSAGTVTINATNVSCSNNGEIGILTGNPGGALSVTLNLTNVDLIGNVRGLLDFTPGSVINYSGGSISDNAAVGYQTDAASGRNHTLDGVTISGNGEAGMGLFGQGVYTIMDSTLEGNTFEGIARFFNPTASATEINVIDSIIRNNLGAGIRIDLTEETNVTVNGSDIHDNGGEGPIQILGAGGKMLDVSQSRLQMPSGIGLAGIVFVADGILNMENTLVESGSATGVLLASNSGVGGGPDAVIDFSTIVGDGVSENSGVVADIQGGGTDEINLTVRNSIVADYENGIHLSISPDPGTTGFPLFNSTASTHNLIYVTGDEFSGENTSPPTPGANTITGQDPLFAGGGVYELTGDSPAIGAANPSTTIAVDILDRARPNPDGDTSNPDIGAYEFHGEVVTRTADWIVF